MASVSRVHRCLFCPQTFDNAAAKDDHILVHFVQETCGDCNRNLIRIGRNMYTLHCAATCVKDGFDSQEHIESNCNSHITTQQVPIINSHILITSNGEHNGHIDDIAPSEAIIQLDELQIKDEQMQNHRQQQLEWDYPRELYEFSTQSSELVDLQPQVSLNTNQADEMPITNGDDLTSNRLPLNDLLLIQAEPSVMEEDVITMNGQLNIQTRRQPRTEVATDKTVLIRKTTQAPAIKTTQVTATKTTQVPAPKTTQTPAITTTQAPAVKIKQEKQTIQKRRTSVLTRERLACHTCKIIFISAESLCRHMKLKHKVQKRFGCISCQVFFTTGYSLRRHKCKSDPQFKKDTTHKNEVESPLKPYNCRCCGGRFATVEERAAHKAEIIQKTKVDKFVTRFECEICNKLYQTQYSVRRHMLQVHNKKPESNESKEQQASNSDGNKGLAQNEVNIDEQLKLAVKSVAQSEKEDVPKNNAQSVKRIVMKKILKRKVGNGEQHLKTVQDTGVYCEICGKKLCHDRSLQSHMRIIHNIRAGLLHCDICKKTFRGKGNLRMHMHFKHDPSVATNCVNCGVVFKNKAMLQNHKCSSPFPCDICGKVLRTRDGRKQHKRKIHGIRETIFCKICMAKFTNTRARNEHFKKCSLKRPIEKSTVIQEVRCAECNNCFESVESLRDHIKLQHTDRKVFEYDLKDRHNEHSPLKPYYCRSCGGRFATIEERTAHKEGCMTKTKTYNTETSTRASTTNFKCKACQKVYQTKSSFRRHMLKCYYNESKLG